MTIWCQHLQFLELLYHFGVVNRCRKRSSQGWIHRAHSPIRNETAARSLNTFNYCKRLIDQIDDRGRKGKAKAMVQGQARVSSEIPEECLAKSDIQHRTTAAHLHDRMNRSGPVCRLVKVSYVKEACRDHKVFGETAHPSSASCMLSSALKAIACVLCWSVFTPVLPDLNVCY